MSEFNNRIDSQRDALKIINENCLFKEPLLSLSKKAIDRWISINQISVHEKFVLLILEISENLFFLANKSQEQVTEDYKIISDKVFNLLKNLRVELASKS